MNAKLIMLPQPILVSMKEPIVERSNDCFYSFETSKIYSCKEFHSAISCYKIIAGIDTKLDLSAIAEKIGWVDVEKLALEECVCKTKDCVHFKMYLKGYKAAQSLNEKKYSEKDLKQAIKLARKGYDEFNENGFIRHGFDFTEEQILQSLSLSKPKEYNVDCIQEGNTIKVTKILS